MQLIGADLETNLCRSRADDLYASHKRLAVVIQKFRHQCAYHPRGAHKPRQGKADLFCHPLRLPC